MLEARLLIWGSVDHRDDRNQLIIDDCRAIDDLRFLLIDLLYEEACDIEVQHRLRECLQRHRPSKDEFGIKVAVVAAISNGPDVRHVRLGHQFCVRDAGDAVTSLQNSSFKASFSASLVN